MNLIKKYFSINDTQYSQFEKMMELYQDWNQKINLISRKDIENLEERHILHSLAIAKFIQFKKGARILDLGCGGGFPGIMLAVFFPDNDLIQKLDLKNAKAIHGRAEELKNQKFDFIVTRAVAKIDKLLFWSERLFSEEQKHSLPNGIIALKGNIKDEISLLKKDDYFESLILSEYFEEAFFEQKHLLYVQY